MAVQELLESVSARPLQDQQIQHVPFQTQFVLEVPITFTAQANGTEADVVNPGNDYDCLITSPNPSWYYLEISNSGNLAIDITAGSDVDFAIWGPYADLATAVANCDGHGTPADCSYSTAAIEQANVAGAIAGEVYVLLVTNFANTVQTINVNDAPSNTATTDCSIVPLPVEFAELMGSRNADGVHLTWTTATEQNNDYFVIERSSDATVWTAFDLIDGVGNSTSTTYYSTTDRNPHEGVNYYRVKQFDFDGTSSISDIIAVTAEQLINVNIAP